MYFKNQVLSQMAADLITSFKQITKNLYYDKTYTGTITAKAGNVYTVKVHGNEYKIKCNYTFPIGKTVDVKAKQNNMNNLAFVVNYDDLVR